MFPIEKRCWDYLIRQRYKILAGVATLLTLLARYTMRGIISADMSTCLLPWYETIESLGGFKSLSTQVGDYNILYQTLIALMTYLPIEPIYAYKALSICFDYALGIAVGLTVRETTKSNQKAILAYVIIISLPVVVLNSAAWGQCDSIFTCFLVLTFLCLLKENHIAAMLLYGISLAFKLQAVFFLPFLLFYYVWSRKFSIVQFCLVPVPSFVLSLGGILQGRSVLAPIEIYMNQTGLYPRISLNYPSFWNLLVANNVKDGSDHYVELRILCILLTILILAILMIRMISHKQLSTESLTLSVVAMIHTCTLFLPAMHERYAYPVLIFAVLACFQQPKAILPAIGLIVIDMQTYGNYLFYTEMMPWEFLVLINISCYAFLIQLLFVSQFETARKAGALR